MLRLTECSQDGRTNNRRRPHNISPHTQIPGDSGLNAGVERVPSRQTSGHKRNWRARVKTVSGEVYLGTFSSYDEADEEEAIARVALGLSTSYARRRSVPPDQRILADHQDRASTQKPV